MSSQQHLRNIFESFQEHHLQRALSAQQVYGTAEALTIPIPDVDESSERYDGLYPRDFKQPKQFIHLQGNIDLFILKYECKLYFQSRLVVSIL